MIFCFFELHEYLKISNSICSILKVYANQWNRNRPRGLGMCITFDYHCLTIRFFLPVLFNATLILYKRDTVKSNSLIEIVCSNSLSSVKEHSIWGMTPISSILDMNVSTDTLLTLYFHVFTTAERIQQKLILQDTSLQQLVEPNICSFFFCCFNDLILII